MKKQPKPRNPVKGISVTDAAINLLQHRRKQGIKTYGVELMAGNGRDFFVDAIEEVADLFLYLLQGYIEVKGGMQLVRKTRRHAPAKHSQQPRPKGKAR